MGIFSLKNTLLRKIRMMARANRHYIPNCVWHSVKSWEPMVFMNWESVTGLIPAILPAKIAV